MSKCVEELPAEQVIKIRFFVCLFVWLRTCFPGSGFWAKPCFPRAQQGNHVPSGRQGSRAADNARWKVLPPQTTLGLPPPAALGSWGAAAHLTLPLCVS